VKINHGVSKGIWGLWGHVMTIFTLLISDIML